MKKFIFIFFSFLLFGKSLKAEEQNVFALSSAAYENDINKVKLLLKDPIITNEQINPKCPNNSRCKPITFASENGNIEMIKLLLNAGADINGKTGGSGDTPLIIAIMKKNAELTRFLIENGADINLANNFGATPFWGACAMGDEFAVDLMLKTKKTDINYPGRFPNPLNGPKEIVTNITPLMIAIKHNHHKIVSALIESGANINAKDSMGRTAMMYAENASLKIKEMLNNVTKNEIEPMHQACKEDSDCTRISLKCSCDCGIPINKKFISSYLELKEAKCKGYSGPFCKMDCSGVSKCNKGLCEIS